MSRLSLAVAITCGCAQLARADGLVVTDTSPRSIGRAGTGTVGDDGGGALLVNPAALARRDSRRAQVGMTIIDDAIDFTSASSGVDERDQAGSRVAPFVAAAGSLGGFIIGAAAMTSAVAARALAKPDSGPEQEAGMYDARYAGLVGSLRRDTVTVGAAKRLGDELAIGLSLAGSRVAIVEERQLWAGVPGRDAPGDPHDDVDVAMSAQDGLAPSAVFGLLFAPDGTPLELGASAAWTGTAHANGSITALGTPGGPSISTTAPSASIDVPASWTFRAGARYAGSRWAAELDGDLFRFGGAAASASWRVTDVRVVDPTGATAALTEIPSRLSATTHAAVRASIDAELIAGWLWATAGYAFTSAGTSPARMSPTFGELAGHTLGLGLEATAGGFTLTVGWSRSWLVASSAASRLTQDDPFTAVSAPVPAGSYDGSIDQVGALLDVELDAPN